MIRHVVRFTWSPEATEEQTAADAAELSALPGQIPQIRSYAFGPIYVGGSRSRGARIEAAR